jgi:hypothetical protein
MGATMTENTGPNLGNRFRKGQSGNPAGKPKGARHKTKLLAERLMQDDAENIVNAVLTAARNGDMTAAKIILDRLVPVRRAVSFDLPKIECKADVVPANAAILAAVADGDLTPGDAAEISKLVKGFVRTLEISALEAGLAALKDRGRGETDREPPAAYGTVAGE